MKTVIIYNQFNHDAVVAAAIAAAHYPNAVALDFGKHVKDDYDQYIWIGVSPMKVNVKNSKSRKHTVFLNKTYDGKVGKVKDFSDSDFMADFPMEGGVLDNEDSLAQDVCIDTFHRDSLCEKVCASLKVTDPLMRKLAFHVSGFHSKKTEAQYLAFIYFNLAEAHNCILTGDKFVVRETDKDDVAKYMAQARVSAKMLKDSYYPTKMVDGGFSKLVAYTAFSDFNFHLALRMVKLAHEKFINISMGINGLIVYTNLQDTSTIRVENTPVVVN